MCWACGRTQLGLFLDPSEGEGGATGTGGASGTGIGGSGAFGTGTAGSAVAGSTPFGGMGGTGGTIPMPRAGDAGMGGETGVRITLMPQSLPGGLVDAAYAVTITARGGASDTYVFELERGALPPGLALSEDGSLAGTPTELGQFSFTIRATDARGNAGRREYTLRIGDRRWLTYTAFESSSSSRQRLVLQDYLDPDSEPIVVTEQPTYDAQFSPDGSRFAFSTMNNGSIDRLYVLDLTGDAPGVPRQVAVSGLRVFHWAPDGQKLLVIESPDGNALELRYVDWSTGVPSESMLIARGTFAGWVTPNRITYQAEAGRFTVVDWENGRLRTPRASAVEGRGSPWLPSLAFVETPESERWLVDLDTLEASELPVPAIWHHHPSLPLVAEMIPANDLIRFRRVWGTAVGEPLLSVTGKTAWFHWAHQEPWASKLDGSQLVLVQLGDEPRETPLAGVFTSSDDLRFSSDDRWFASLHQGAFQLVRLTENGARQASGPVAFPVAQFKFGPDGRALLLLSVSDTGNVGIHAFALRGENAVPLRTIELDSTWVEPHQSSDDGYVAYVYGSASMGRALSIADLSDPASPPRLIASCRSGSDRPLCPNTVRFQP